MQVEYQEHGLLVPWAESVASSYSDLPLEESTPDLLASNSPASEAPPHHHLAQHHQHQQPHHLHLYQHRQSMRGLNYVSSTPVSYVTPYTPTSLPEADLIGQYEYTNSLAPSLISQPLLEMRPDADGRTETSEATHRKRGGKRKREDKNEEEEMQQQAKLDPNLRCDVCGEQASGHYFGAVVCLPCKSFFIRCTKDGRPSFSSQCGGKCDVLKGGRVRCQHCRFQKCISAGMYRKEKPEAVEPAEGQLLCKVCGDIANGVHFGVTTCEGCKKFFRRGLKENRTYTCKGNNHCSINPRMRNNCRFCRYQKCLMEGMSREAIKMGRPKKGEMAYRRSLKNHKIKQLAKEAYEKQFSESNRSSMSSEYEQDDVSVSDEVFGNQHHLHQDAQQQLSSHIQQQQQQQQTGSFSSLAGILHDCMTVQDWDQKVVDLNGADHGDHRIIPLSLAGHDMAEGGSTSPHKRHPAPTLLSEMLSRQMQQHSQHQEQQQQQHFEPQHHVQLQQVKVLDPVEANHQGRHQILVYQPNSMDIIGDMDYANGSDLPMNRAIKVENVSLQDEPGSEYPNTVVLENMHNLEVITKSEFQGYQMQHVDSSPHPNYSHSNPRIAAGSPVHDDANGDNSSKSALVSISHLQPSANSQIVAINMSSQSVLYTPHNHHDPIIIQNAGQLDHTSLALMQDQILHQSKMDVKAISNELTMDQLRDNKAMDLYSSGRAHQVFTNNDFLRTAPVESDLRQSEDVKLFHVTPSSRGQHIIANHNLVTSVNHLGQQNLVTSHGMYSQVSPNPSMQQQFLSAATSVPSLESSTIIFTETSGSKRPHSTTPEQAGLSVVTSNGHHPVTSLPTIFISSAQNPLGMQNKASGIKSPIAALLQQHRHAIQAGRPIQLSAEEIEEIINSVNAEHQLHNEQNSIKEQQNQLADHNSIEFRKLPVTSYTEVCEKQQQTNVQQRILPQQLSKQQTDLSQWNGQTTPHSVRSYSISPGQQQTNVSATQTLSHLLPKTFPTEVNSHSPTPTNGERPEPNRSYVTNIGDQHGSSYTTPYSRSVHSPTGESYEDSFNSSLIRDSTLLHEINRIFLGIDNSCEPYGCGRSHGQSQTNEGSSLNEGLIMSPDEFVPEISHKYWHGFGPSGEFLAMSQERKKIIQDVLEAFDSLEKTYMTTEPDYNNKKMSQDQIEHWHHIQRRIARHVVAGQRFCRNIPGYLRLDIQDRISLGKHVGFGLMVLIACTEFYDSEFKRFKHIWNWTMPMQNPLFSYKLHLLTLGHKLHEIQVDRTEAALMCAISMTSIDCPGLLKPEVVCQVRDVLLDALEAHICSKSEPSDRLRQLLSIMPQVRLMTVWYNNLMKKMSLPSDLIKSQTSRSKLLEALGSGNTLQNC